VVLESAMFCCFCCSSARRQRTLLLLLLLYEVALPRSNYSHILQLYSS